ncbi:MAG: hypothetical protein EOO73_07160 [Myxococcales bacterium]|nr:MAG: hypothetical protein EOO73_07160 [Myxococcales bacterium]
MTIRTQLKSWLFASSLFSAIAYSHAASAAHPGAASAPVSTSPKASPSLVKPAAKNILPAHVTPLRLRLTSPVPHSALPPAVPKKETLILGMRLPTFIAFGLSGISAGGALATGIAATRGNDPNTCDSRCTEHGVRERALLLTTGVLTGLAAAGLTVGFTLMLKAPANPTRDAIRPRLDFGVSDTKAVAKIGWVFSSF